MSTDTDNTWAALQNVQTCTTILPRLSAGMSRLGLDFASLASGCQSTMVNAHLLGTDLDSLFAVWETLQPGIPEQVAALTLRRLLIGIVAAAKDVSSFRTAATSLQVTTETATGQLNIAIAATKQRIQDEQNEVAQRETDMRNIQTRSPNSSNR